MELKIEVDETKFKDVIENELKAFSKDELHEIIRECIVEYLREEKTIEMLFVHESQDYYGKRQKEPSEVLFTAAKSIDLSPAYKEIQELMISTLKENHAELIEKVMLELIVNGISDNHYFKANLRDTIQLIVSEMNNRNN